MPINIPPVWTPVKPTRGNSETYRDEVQAGNDYVAAYARSMTIIGLFLPKNASNLKLAGERYRKARRLNMNERFEEMEGLLNE